MSYADPRYKSSAPGSTHQHRCCSPIALAAVVLCGLIFLFSNPATPAVSNFAPTTDHTSVRKSATTTSSSSSSSSTGSLLVDYKKEQVSKAEDPAYADHQQIVQEEEEKTEDQGDSGSASFGRPPPLPEDSLDEGEDQQQLHHNQDSEEEKEEESDMEEINGPSVEKEGLEAEAPGHPKDSEDVDYTEDQPSDATDRGLPQDKSELEVELDRNQSEKEPTNSEDVPDSNDQVEDIDSPDDTRKPPPVNGKNDDTELKIGEGLEPDVDLEDRHESVNQAADQNGKEESDEDTISTMDMVIEDKEPSNDIQDSEDKEEAGDEVMDAPPNLDAKQQSASEATDAETLRIDEKETGGSESTEVDHVAVVSASSNTKGAATQENVPDIALVDSASTLKEIAATLAKELVDGASVIFNATTESVATNMSIALLTPMKSTSITTKSDHASEGAFHSRENVEFTKNQTLDVHLSSASNETKDSSKASYEDTSHAAAAVNSTETETTSLVSLLSAVNETLEIKTTNTTGKDTTAVTNATYSNSTTPTVGEDVKQDSTPAEHAKSHSTTQAESKDTNATRLNGVVTASETSTQLIKTVNKTVTDYGDDKRKKEGSLRGPKDKEMEAVERKTQEGSRPKSVK